MCFYTNEARLSPVLAALVSCFPVFASVCLLVVERIRFFSSYGGHRIDRSHHPTADNLAEGAAEAVLRLERRPGFRLARRWVVGERTLQRL